MAVPAGAPYPHPMSAHRRVPANGIEIEYDTIGDPSSPALVLVHGFTAQLIEWDERFCRMLADEGFLVVRFDNRDAGRSTHFTGTPDVAAILAGERWRAPYSVDDMADDVAALVGALGVDGAHVVGGSMGGIIAQLVAIRHPGITRSLCSMMCTTGAPGVGQMSAEGVAAMAVAPPATPEEAMAQAIAAARVGNPESFDEDRLRRMAAATYERDHDPTAASRQVAAMAVSTDRTAALASVAAPTLVIHGSADRLIDVSGGHATAAAVPGARLLVVEGMGHELPEARWPLITAAIAGNARRAIGDGTAEVAPAARASSGDAGPAPA
jgi:pimeloyl-ACP methyl ester carboxylesterase